MIFIAHVDGIGVWRTRRAGGGNKLELALINSFHRTWLKMWKTGTWFLFRARFGWNCTPSAFALRRFVALGRVRKSQTPLGWNCTPSAFALGRFVALGRVWKSQPPPPTPPHVEITLGRMWKLQTPPAWLLHSEDLLPMGECENYKPHPHGPHGIALRRMRRLQAPPAWNCTWKIFLALAGITSPTRMELHLEDFSPLRELQAPPAWNCTWKIFLPLGGIINPTGVELHLEDFSPLRENQIPRRGGIALARSSQTPPGWKCTRKIFSPWARITNPTGWIFRGFFAQTPPGRIFSPKPDGFALSRIFSRPNPTGVEYCTWKMFCPWANHKPHPDGIALGRCFALGRESQTPPGWNCTWKIFCPWARISNPTQDGIAVWKIFCSQTPHGWNFTLEYLSPLGKNYKPRRGGIALWMIFHPCENYKPHPGGIAIGRFFALGRGLQTPPAWNWTRKISRPRARITNPTRMELHFGGFLAQTPPGWN